jgi:hypothetical protein
MSAKQVNQVARQLLVFTIILLVLLLTSVNIENYLMPKKVLGVKSVANSDKVFWQDFLKKNPNYIPGWVEIGRMDKVKEIDPNYELGTRN